MANIVLKDKIKIDNNFINDLIAKSWQDSESIQNQIASIEIDSPQANKLVELLKNLLTSYYVFTGCLENIEREQINNITEPAAAQIEEPISILEEPTVENSTDNMDINILDEFDTETTSEPFEYFVEFDEPTGEPLTDDDLYS